MIFSCPEWAIILQYCDYATVRLCQYNIFLVIKFKLACELSMLKLYLNASLV